MELACKKTLKNKNKNAYESFQTLRAVATLKDSKAYDDADLLFYEAYRSWCKIDFILFMKILLLYHLRTLS